MGNQQDLSPRVAEGVFEAVFPPIRDIAQFGSALHWGCRGRGFKSRYSDESVMKSEKWSHRRSVEYKSVNKIDTVAVSFTRAATLRDVAQMVERRVRDAEVASSNLVIPSGGENKYTFPNEVSACRCFRPKW